MLSFVFQIYCWCRTWYASHCIGSVILALPILAVFTNFNCQVTHHHYVENQRDLFIQLVFVSLAHFCNLSALNYCFKSLLATISASGTSSSLSVEKSAFFCQSDFTWNQFCHFSGSEILIWVNYNLRSMQKIKKNKESEPPNVLKMAFLDL